MTKTLEEILGDDRVIKLPAIMRIPAEKLKEYYEIMIKLQQAA